VQLEERDSSGWAMKALREAGGTLVSEFAGLDDDALRQRPAEGELSLKEIAAHLRDAEKLVSAQITSAVETPRKTLPHWDVDVLPYERDYRGSDLLRVLGELRELRRETTSLLWMLSGSEWRRRVRHPYRGEITVETIARELAQHDLEHLWQVRRLKHELIGERAVNETRAAGGWEDDASW
jgi:hypothetical protein